MTYHVRQPASDIQTRHMIQARFMLAFTDYHSKDRSYNDIVQEVWNSRSKAGGPALRLANAVWDLEYALRFPKTKALQLREETSFAGLYGENGKLLVDSKWLVGKAMQKFVLLRNQHCSQAPMAMLGKEDIELPERQELVRLFWLLWTHRKKPYVQNVMNLFIKVNPASQHHFVPQMRTVASAISAFENGQENCAERLAKMKSLLRQDWVHQTQVGDAISLFQTELDQRLSPS